MANIDKIQIGTTTYNIAPVYDSGGNTITSTYVKKSGDTMTGTLILSNNGSIITNGKSSGASWNENFRANRASDATWAGYVLGGPINSTSGSADYQWAISTPPKSMNRRLIISHNNHSSDGLTYFGVDSANQLSPWLQIGDNLYVKGTIKTGDHVTQQYNSTTQALDFIFS